MVRREKPVKRKEGALDSNLEWEKKYMEKRENALEERENELEKWEEAVERFLSN